MLIVSAAAGLFVLEMSQSEILTKAVIMTGAGAISGAMTELFSPSECDTITVPIKYLLCCCLFLYYKPVQV